MTSVQNSTRPSTQRSTQQPVEFALCSKHDSQKQINELQMQHCHLSKWEYIINIYQTPRHNKLYLCTMKCLHTSSILLIKYKL